jgi:hypothetical protein
MVHIHYGFHIFWKDILLRTITQPFHPHPEKWFWGRYLRFFQVATLKKIWVFRTWLFSAWPPEFFFLICGIKPTFFSEWRPGKISGATRLAQPKIFLRFVTKPDFSNHKSGCRLKGRLYYGGFCFFCFLQFLAWHWDNTGVTLGTWVTL